MESQKNILIMVNSFWVNAKGMSGGDEMTFQIFKRIKPNFDSLIWLTNEDGAKNIRLFTDNPTIIITPGYFEKFPISIGYFLKMLFACITIYKYKFNFIYSSSDFFPDVIPSWLYQKINKETRWIQCVYHLYPSYKIRAGNIILNFLLQSSQKFSLYLSKTNSKVVTINSDVYTDLLNLGYDINNLTIITPGIDFAVIQSSPKALIRKENINAVFLGRIKVSKGVFDLLDIWSLVIKEKENLQLTIIGSGEEKIQNELHKQIRLKKLEKNISVIGFVDSEKKYELMKNSNVFIFPSHEEGFGIAIAEALACSMNVLVWDLPVYEEIYGNNIIKIDMGNNFKFSQEIISYLDKNIKNTTGKNFSKKFDWEIVSKNMKKWIINEIE